MYQTPSDKVQESFVKVNIDVTQTDINIVQMNMGRLITDDGTAQPSERADKPPNTNSEPPEQAGKPPDINNEPPIRADKPSEWEVIDRRKRKEQSPPTQESLRNS